MQAIAAHSVAASVRDLLMESREIQGLVMGSWPTAAYIDTGDFVIAVVGRAGPFMPNAITVTERGGLDAFPRGAPVRLSRSEIRCAGVVVRLAGAQMRDIRVPRNEGRSAADVSRRGEELLGSFGPGAGEDLIRRARALSLDTGNGAAAAIDLLGRALADLDPVAAARAAALLAGRGPGLTPEGDDVLASCAAGLLAFSEPCGLPGAEAGRMVRALTADMHGRTGPLSATLLRLAAEGRLVEPAARVLDLGRRPDHWSTSLTRLMSFGHSTGRAYAFGISVGATHIPSLQPTTRKE